MLIADLKTVCPACGGSGQKPGLMAGGIAQINVGGRCVSCDGRGFVLTDLGRDLWKVFQPFVEELVRERIESAAKH